MLFISFNASASILTNLNGVEYEWLELVYTKGLSRDQVEVLLGDESSLFYGYEYPVIAQVFQDQALFFELPGL